MSVPDGARADDRVRACPACGEIIPFDERTCPACGHLDPLRAGLPDEPDVPCPHCREPMSSRGLFCAHCGRERALPPAPAAAGPVPEPQAGGLDRLAVVLALAGPLALLAAVLLVYL